MLEQYKIALVQYTKKNTSETTQRAIIPTFIPGDSIKAIDVSHLTEEEALRVATALQEYQNYVDAAMTKIFSFDDWVDHTQSQVPPSKWRTFLVENLTVLGENSK